MTARHTTMFSAALLLAAAWLGATGAAAKTCKDPVTTKATSRAELSDKEARARTAALAQWRTRARANYGVAYRFWSRAEDRNLTCTQTEKSATCTATARPCRLL